MLQKWCIRSHGEFKRGRKIAREIREFSRQPLTEAGLEIPSAQLPAAVFGTGSPPGAKFVRRRFPELLRLPAPATSDHGCRSAGKGERYALPPEILRNKFFTRIRFPTPMFEAIHSYERRPRFLRRFSRLATCFFFYNLLSLSADVEVHAAASAPRHASRRSIRSNETPKAAQILGLWGCRGPIRFASTSDLADGSAVALATAERTRESSLEQGLGPQDVVSIGASSRGNRALRSADKGRMPEMARPARSAVMADSICAARGGQAGAAAPSTWSGARIAMLAAAWAVSPAGEPAPLEWIVTVG
jgi:hypothetical protein